MKMRLLSLFVLILSFGVLKGQKREIQWFYQFGSWGAEDIRNVKVDGNRNIFICQTFDKPVDIDFGPKVNLLHPFNGKDLLITKLDSNGMVIWNNHIRGAYDEYSVGTALDDSMNLYVYGNFAGSIQFNPADVNDKIRSNNDSRDIFLAKYSTDGKFQWVKQIGGDYSYERAQAIVVKGNNIHLLGTFERTFTFDGHKKTDTLISESGEQSFLARLDLSGNLQELKHIEGKSDVISYAMDVDSAGNIYVGYHFSNEVYIFDGWKRTIKAKGNRDFIIQKFNKNGHNIWYRHFSDGGYDNINDIRVDKNGDHLFAVGTFQRTMNFNPNGGAPENLTSVLGNDGYVLKLSSQGRFQWVKQFGTPRSEWLGHITLFSDTSIAVCGQFREQLKAPGINGDTLILENNGSGDAIIIHMNNEGGLLWMKGIGGSGEDVAVQVEPDHFGNLFVIGTFTNTLTYQSNNQTIVKKTSNNFADGYLLKFGYPNQKILDTTSKDSTLNTGNFINRAHNTIVFPNPVKDVILVKNLQGRKNVQIVINDNLGREIFRKSYFNQSEISIKNEFTSGVYYLSIKADRIHQIHRFLVED